MIRLHLDTGGSGVEPAGGWWKSLWWVPLGTVEVMVLMGRRWLGCIRLNDRDAVIFKERYLGTDWTEECKQKIIGQVWWCHLWMKGFWQCGKVEVTDRSRTRGNRRKCVPDHLSMHHGDHLNLYLVQSTCELDHQLQHINQEGDDMLRLCLNNK